MGKRRHPEVYTKRWDRHRAASLAAKARRGQASGVAGEHGNWKVKALDHCVIAFEPDGVHEQVFSGGPDPFWDAVQFAARCLRGEMDPAALP